MQFYLQAAIVEKGVDVKQYAESRAEVIVGCVAMAFIKFFIIVCAAGAIWSVQPREIHDAAEAALALRPLGPYAYYLFAGGLFTRLAAGGEHPAVVDSLLGLRGVGF